MNTEEVIVDFKLLSVSLDNDKSKRVAAILSTISFAIFFTIFAKLIDKYWNLTAKPQLYKSYEFYMMRKKTSFKDDADKEQKLEHSYWITKNLQISFIHSTVSSLWILNLFWRQSYMFDDLLTYVSYESYILVSFSCGYFLYDFMDMLVNGKVVQMWIVSVHHVVVLCLFEFHLSNIFAIGYSLIALSMEFNSIFLHARKLLKFYSFDRSHPIVRCNSFLNVTSFVIFRFGILAFIAIGISLYHYRVTKVYLSILISSFSIMGIMNTGIFYIVILKDYRQFTGAKYDSKTIYANGDSKLE